MPKHHEKRALPFRPEQLFDLVADIERYPEFLPWCKGARILKRDGNIVTADLVAGYKMFREKFTSVVTFDRPRSISVTYISGPLAHLKNEWAFQPGARSGCDLIFDVDFDLRSQTLAGLVEMFLDKAIAKMAAAFEARAYELYGKN